MLKPSAEKRTHAIKHLGHEWTDSFFWLRDIKDPKVMEYLKAENAHFEAHMAPLKPLQDQVFEELKSRVAEDDDSVPVRLGDWEYFSRVSKGNQYREYCRKKPGSHACEVILDLNLIAKGAEYCSLGAYQISPCCRYVAYSIDLDGSENFTLKILELGTSRDLGVAIASTNGDVAWSADSQHLFYAVVDKSLRPFQVYRTEVATVNPQLVYEEKDGRFFVGVELSKDKTSIMIDTHAAESTETWVIDATRPIEKPRLISPRREKIETTVWSHGSRFYFLTNDGCTNFKLYRSPKNDLANQTEVLRGNDELFLVNIDVFKNHLVVLERLKGLPRLRLISIQDMKETDTTWIAMNEEVYTLSDGGNVVWDAPHFRYQYSSPTTPPQVIDYDFTTQAKTVKKEQPVPNYNRELYVAKRVFAKASDGVEIPISVITRKDYVQDGSRPFVLYGYGSYGMPTNPGFNANLFSLLDRGFGYAMAHIRGGSDLGRQWYLDGKFEKKMTTFTDFIACAESLIQNKWAHPKKLSIRGGSAGGLLVGACMNLRPDLYQNVVAHVPFVDVLNTMLDTTLPLTLIEYDEWGNPNDPKYFAKMQEYSPYDNVEDKAYPNLFVTAGLNDPRVTYWEPAKWVAKIRTLTQHKNEVLFKTHLGAGHGGSSGRYSRLQEIAEEFAFLIKQGLGTSR